MWLGKLPAVFQYFPLNNLYKMAAEFFVLNHVPLEILNEVIFFFYPYFSTEQNQQHWRN